MTLVALAGLLIAPLLPAAPATDVRVWKSSAGTTIEGKATALDGTVATLETTNGRILKVDLAKLSTADGEFLQLHFSSAPAVTAPVELAHPAGTVVGPLEVEGSHYLLYVPKSLKAGRKAPLLFYTHSGGGAPAKFKPLMEGAEICGWIIGMSVESKNAMPVEESTAHCKHALDQILKTLPVDPERVYFSGSSGGTRVAFNNSVKFKSAGVMAVIAGAQPEQMDRKRHYFFINGCTDYNRYDSSKSYAEAKSSSAMRFHPGSHGDGPEWLKTEGLVWLESKWREKNKPSAPERLDFEASAMDWLDGMKSTAPHRAAWWAAQLTTMGLSPGPLARATAITKELGASADSVAYAKGITEIEKFAADILAVGPVYSPDCFLHTSPEIQKKIDKLLETYKATPWVGEVLTALKEKTGKG